MTNNQKAKLILQELDNVISVNWNFESQYLNAIVKGLQKIDKAQPKHLYINQSTYSYSRLTYAECPECEETTRHEVWEHDITQDELIKCQVCLNVSNRG